MIVGFNHNFRYKNEIFHVQTEDGGLKSPSIITLLYRGGTILASKKTSYADITKVDKLDQVIEELMKEQHKEMLQRLKSGEFDEVIVASQPPARMQPVSESPPTAAPPPPPSMPTVEPTAEVVEEPAAVQDQPVAGESTSPAGEPASEPGLDDLILSYLVNDDK